MSLSRSAPNLFVASIIAGFFLVGIVLIVILGAVTGLSFLIAGTWGAMLIGHPKRVLLFYWCWATVGPYFHTLYPSMLTVWGDEMLIALMLGILLTHHIRARIHLPELRVVRRVLLGLAALILLSAFANRVPSKLVFHFCLQYMRFFLLVYYTYYFLSARDLKAVVLTIVGLFLLQFIVNMGWLFHVNPMPNWMGGPDFAIGSGLGANIVAYFAIAVICLAVAYIRRSARASQKALGVILLVVALVQLYFSFTFHAYMICAACVVFQLWLVPAPLHTRFAQAGMAGLAAVVVVALALALPGSHAVKTLLRPDFVKYRWRDMVDGPKGQSYKNSIYYLPKDLPYPIIGGGPGNVGSMVARLNRRPLADRYFNWVAMSVEVRELTHSGSISAAPTTGLLTLWTELGPLGMLLYWGVQAYAAMRVGWAVRRGRYKGRYKRILAEAFTPTMMMLLGLNVLTDYAFIAFMNGGIWIWAACVWTPEESEVPPSARMTDVVEPSDVWRKVLAERAPVKA
ncbi:MAG: hypothetical protein V1790_19815 [Planctomycetota bacterium]